MKFKYKMLLTVTMATSFVITACNFTTINLISSEFTVNVDSELNTDISEYVRASNERLETMTLDVSHVKMDQIGDYTAIVSDGESTTTFTIKVADIQAPIITLNSYDIYIENLGTLRLTDVVDSISDYSEFEYGFADDMTKADADKELLESVKFDNLGDYNTEIVAKDIYGNISVMDFQVHVVNKGEVPLDSLSITDFSSYMNESDTQELQDLESYDTEGVYFGVGLNFDSETNRPNLDYYVNKYQGLGVDFIQPMSEYIWLTFNEISEYGYTDGILDTLQEKEVSAVFFITLSYAKENPEIISRMITEGHVLGSYISSGIDIPDLSLNELTTELDTLYNYVYKTYGYEMYLFRPSSGYYTEQSIAVAQSLGYRTVFWSFAYADWDSNNQPNVDEALQNALDKAHGGAIYLLSGASLTNSRMLEDMIDGIRDRGLNFAIYQNN